MVTSLDSSSTNDEITLTRMVGYSTCANIISFVYTNEPLHISQPPPPSSRPPVTGYKISHNTSGSITLSFTSVPKFVIKGVAPGVYFFIVLAVNALGDGKEESMSIMGEINIVVQRRSGFSFLYTCIHIYIHTAHTYVQ